MKKILLMITMVLFLISCRSEKSLIGHYINEESNEIVEIKMVNDNLYFFRGTLIEITKKNSKIYKVSKDGDKEIGKVDGDMITVNRVEYKKITEEEYQQILDEQKNLEEEVIEDPETNEVIEEEVIETESTN